MLRDIAAAFAEDGHDVHVFASRPSYRDGTAGGNDTEHLDLEITRCFAFQGEKKNPAKRIANVILYCLALMWRILRLRPDIVTASTFPPVAAAWCASLAAKIVGAKFIYHMQDIHPEVSVYSGGIMGRGLVRRVFTWLDNQTLRRSAAIIVLSQDMAETLENRGIGALPVQVINNFDLSSSEASDPVEVAAFAKEETKVRAIFAGNLGRFQDLPELAEGVATCFDRHPNLELMFLGSGNAEQELKAKWGDHPQVVFAPFMPFAQAKHLISGADIGLVSLSPDLYRVAYPSKVLTYLGLGLKVLAVVEPHSALANELSSKGIGVVPTDRTPAAISRALETFLTDQTQKEKVAVANPYTRKATIDHWKTLVGSI